MSVETYKHDAGRWLKQGIADLRAAGSSLRCGNFDWACFQAQQAGEKALKAFWYVHTQDPWGHSLLKLIIDYPDEAERQRLETLVDDAKLLDKLYIPTRYPNGLPDLTPSEVYTEDDGQRAIVAAQRIVDLVRAVVS